MELLKPILMPAKRAWIKGALSVILGLTLGAYLLGLLSADLPTDWFALLVVASVLPFIAVVTRDIKRFFITLIILDISLSLDVRLFARPPNSGSLDGLIISLTTISLTILYFLWAAELLAGKAKISLHKSISLPALCFIAAGLISVFNAKDPVLSTFELALNIELFLVFFYLANHLRVPDDFRFITNVLLVGLLLVALSVIAMSFIGSYSFMGLGSGTRVTGSEGIVRSGGLIIHPNPAADVLMSLSMLALAALITRGTTSFGRCLALVALPLGVLALIFTFSRGGWFSFAVAGLVFTLLALHRRWLRWKHVFWLIVVLSLLFFLFREPILLRLFGDDAGAAAARMPLNVIALNMIKSHPWIGVGINNYMAVVQDYLTPETYRAWLSSAHNKYLLIWSETGTFGLLAFILFYLAIGRETWQCYKSDHPVFSPLGAAILASLCGYATHMMGDRFENRSILLLLWLIAAIAVSMRNLLSARNGSLQYQECSPQPAKPL